jgi:hypothetical protein
MTTPARRQRLGRALTILGAVGVVLTLVAGIIAFVLVGRIQHSVDENLAVTVDALETIDGTIEVSRQVVDSIGAALDAVGDTVTTVGDSTSAMGDTLATLQEFVGTTLPQTIDGVQNVLPTIKDVAGTIDTALTGVSNIPFGPDYRPDVPFADTIQQLIDTLDPLDTDLQAMGTNLDGLQTTIDQLGDDLTGIQTALDGIRSDVDRAESELDRYAAVTAEAQRVAEDTRDGLATDMAWMRVLVVVLALALLATQVLTVLVGRLAVDDGSAADCSDDQPAVNASSPAASADPPDVSEPKSLP